MMRCYLTISGLERHLKKKIISIFRTDFKIVMVGNHCKAIFLEFQSKIKFIFVKHVQLKQEILV